MVSLAIRFRLLGGGEISRHTLLQLLQNTNDLAALRCVSLTVTARQERQQRGTIVLRNPVRIHGHVAESRADAALKETAPCHTLLERGDCPGKSINVGGEIRALSVETRSCLGVQGFRACQSLLRFRTRLSGHFDLRLQLHQGTFSSLDFGRRVRDPCGSLLDIRFELLARGSAVALEVFVKFLLLLPLFADLFRHVLQQRYNAPDGVHTVPHLHGINSKKRQIDEGKTQKYGSSNHCRHWTHSTLLR
mmetsp:Transcript_63188/g.167485  ORF Transcript_63188/g.167485 Transcript_63188/m.167485 type:complete len:248 (-) Transcript_63188:35-778(-)